MNTMTTAPAVTSYASQNKGSEAGTIAFRDAAERLTAVAYVSALSPDFPLGLMDYLGERVIAHSLASRVSMADLLRDTIDQADLQGLLASMKATETEAARTLLVAAGIRPDAIAPVDYPTLVQVYVNARNSAGHRFSVVR